MKKLTIVVFLISQSFLALAASESKDEVIPGANISITCQCSYSNQDGIEKIILTAGESNSVTQADIDGCVIEDGKVKNPVVLNENNKPVEKTACWKAKMNASWNCQQSAHSTQPGHIRAPSVLLKQNSCYGAVYINDERIK